MPASDLEGVQIGPRGHLRSELEQLAFDAIEGGFIHEDLAAMGQLRQRHHHVVGSATICHTLGARVHLLVQVPQRLHMGVAAWQECNCVQLHGREIFYVLYGNPSASMPPGVPQTFQCSGGAICSSVYFQVM